VTISQPFYLGIHPVTQAHYEQVMGTNPSWFTSRGGGKAKVKKQDTRSFPALRLSVRGRARRLRRQHRLPSRVDGCRQDSVVFSLCYSFPLCTPAPTARADAWFRALFAVSSWTEFEAVLQQP
jgi:hypothetical protein